MRMAKRMKLLSALAGSGLAGFAIAAVVLHAGSLPASDARIGAATGAGAVAPLCGRSPTAAEATFDGEMGRVTAQMHGAMQIDPSGNADRDFARIMIAHHQGAIEMARLQLKYGRDERMKRVAQSIIVEQAQEIAYLRTLVDAPTGGTSVTDGAANP
jgi:hypothetical protein